MKEKIIRTTKKAVAVGLAVAMALTISPVIGSAAKAKKPTLNKKSISLKVGKTAKLKVKANVVKIKKTKWSSTKSKVAKVSSKGVVTAKKAGKATIKAVVTAKNKKKYTLKCKVKVTKAEEEIFDDSGNWITAKDPEIGEAHTKIFQTINTSIDGVSYSPVATLAYRETDEGTEFRFFARKTIITASPIDSYVILEVVDGSDKFNTYDVTSPVYEKNAPFGAYSLCDTPKLDALEIAAFQKGIEGLTGVIYDPIAKLATQEVGGAINYIFICEATTVTANPVSYYALVNGSIAPEDGVTIGEITPIEIGDGSRKPILYRNAWEKPETPVVDDALKAIVEKATTEFADVTYSPVAWIGKKQSEAGQEYKVFCSATPKLFGGKSTYAILDITENLIGGATITQLSESSMEVFGTDEGAGYAQAGPDISKTEGQYFEEASKTLVGANYTALALLGKKKERGYAFCFIAEQTEIAENAVPSIGLEYVKVDEDGKVTLEKYVDFGSL